MPPTFEPDIKRLSARPFAESLTLLLYGATGTGKTYFAGTAGPRNVIINAGVGLTTLQSPAFLDRYPFDPWDVKVPPTEQPYDYIFDTVEWLVKNKRDDFDCITVDDCSAIRRYAMMKAVQVNQDIKKTATAARAKKDRGLISPEIADYGEEISATEHFLNEITTDAKAHNFHLICTAHERISFNKPSKIGEIPTERAIRPGFTGQTFPDQVPAFFDEVWRSQVMGRGDKKKYMITTQGSGVVACKTRHGGVFPEIIYDATFPYVVAEIKKHKYIPNPDDPTLLIKVS